MTQSEAETQITRILAQLEKDSGVTVDSISIRTWDAGSTLCRAVKKKGVAIALTYRPDVVWATE
jgi:hypothetical protein